MSSFTSSVKWQGVVVGIFIGIIFAPQIAKIPGLGKIPTL